MTLGIVLTPFGKNPDGTSPPFAVNYAGVNRHKLLGPSDPQFNTSGEPGMYYDTPLGSPPRIMDKIRRWKANHTRKLMGLGDIPTDAEMAANRGYTPVTSGWIPSRRPDGKTEYVTGPWLPPNGADYSGTPAPIALSGLRDATSDDLIQTMNMHNDRVFTLALISTTAVAVSALITVFRTLKLIHDKR